MFRELVGAVIFASALAPSRTPPRPIRIRTIMSYRNFDKESQTQALTALRRGLYQDSLIAPASLSDTTVKPFDRRTVLIKGSIARDAEHVKVCFVLVDVLARPITLADTATVNPSDLDSVLTSFGSRYARVLAQDRWPAVLGPRCA